MKATPEQLKMPHTIPYRYTGNTMDKALKLSGWPHPESLSPTTTVAAVHMANAMQKGHPLLIMADCLTQLACLHKARFGCPIAQDYVLGPEWKSAWEGVHGLLNGDYGPIDNGTVSSILYEALEVAGFKESDI